MVKLCLMASHQYPLGPALVFHQEQRAFKEGQPFLPSPGARQDIVRSGSLDLKSHQYEDPWKPITGLSHSDQFVKFDPTVRRPVLIDVQDTRPDSVLFSFGIVEQCTRHEKVMRFLMSGSSEVEKGGFDLSLLSELMGVQEVSTNVHQQPYAPLIYPSSELYAQKPLLVFMGDLVRSSKIMVQPDGRVMFTGTGTDMKDLLSVVAEFYLSKKSTEWKRQSVLVPYFNRWDSIEAQADIYGSSLTLEAATVAPLKRCPEKIKLKPSPKKKNNKKACRERDLYKRNYFHACESLLSLMIDKRRHGKTAILSLKKSGPELPELLNQFSAGIAGTGLAVLFSVVCKVACGRVPLSTSKLFNTGFGFGLVWLSWAVNKLRDAIIHITKNSGKLDLKEEEMMKRVDKSMKEIFFRAATVMAVAALRFA